MDIRKSLKKRVKLISYKIRSMQLKNVPFTNLEILSRDIPDLYTKELCPQNDFYFHAYHLKKYCSLKSNYILKCAIEHGIYNRLYTWELDIKNNMPFIFSIGDYRKEILSQKTDKQHFALGPYIHYVEPSLSGNKLKKEKQRLGKTLLVFPAHSTHHEDVTYDAENFCAEILKIKITHNFDSVRVCLYWKDILNGYSKIYQKYGFECVCAGHMFDKYFLPRLKSIIMSSDITMSNSDGTHLGYCIYLNKPHYLWSQAREYNQDNVAMQEKEYKADLEKKLLEEQQEFEQIFSEYREDISDEQLKIIEKRFSFSKIRSKQELRCILEEAEKQYSKK